MIPKIIHYCWFGNNPFPKLSKKCIKSWRKYCPDYEIIEWNEDNYDLQNAPLYVKQAYAKKKWAFVTDYVRLQIVYEFGGIYLDTDVELLQPLDFLLVHNAFFGFQHDNCISTGLGFGAIKGLTLLLNIMEDYSNIPFVKSDGSMDLTACPERNSHVFKEFGFALDGTNQMIDKIALYGTEYFCPMSWNERKLSITNRTVSIHWYSASWWNNAQRKYEKKRKKQKKINLIKAKLKNVIGTKFYDRLKKCFGENKCHK